MAEVEVRFEREDLEGVVAVGTYLIDAAKRLGIHFDATCDPASDTHYCSVVVSSGGDLLSEDTRSESEYFRIRTRKAGERLACQARLERAGGVVIMTEEKKAEEPVVEAAEEDTSEQYRKEFAELPLEKQIANLVRLETIAFGETISFIINSPFKVADKLMDVMAEFGFKKEEAEKEAVRPEEHKSEKAGEESKPNGATPST